METTSEVKKVLDFVDDKTNCIELNNGAIIDLCHYYRESDCLNQETAFLKIINLAERTLKDISEIRGAIEG